MTTYEQTNDTKEGPTSLHEVKVYMEAETKEEAEQKVNRVMTEARPFTWQEGLFSLAGTLVLGFAASAYSDLKTKAEEEDARYRALQRKIRR